MPPSTTLGGSVLVAGLASVPASSRATGALASTGVSQWWWLGGLGLTYLGVLVLWAETELRPEPALLRWWGRWVPRHRRR